MDSIGKRNVYRNYDPNKKNPVLYVLEQAKARARHLRRENAKKQISIKDRSPSEQIRIRKRWRESSRKYRQMQKEKKSAIDAMEIIELPDNLLPKGYEPVSFEPPETLEPPESLEPPVGLQLLESLELPEGLQLPESLELPESFAEEVIATVDEAIPTVGPKLFLTEEQSNQFERAVRYLEYNPE